MEGHTHTFGELGNNLMVPSAYTPYETKLKEEAPELHKSAATIIPCLPDPRANQRKHFKPEEWNPWQDLYEEYVALANSSRNHPEWKMILRYAEGEECRLGCVRKHLKIFCISLPIITLIYARETQVFAWLLVSEDIVQPFQTSDLLPEHLKIRLGTCPGFSGLTRITKMVYFRHLDHSLLLSMSKTREIDRYIFHLRRSDHVYDEAYMIAAILIKLLNDGDNDLDKEKSPTLIGKLLESTSYALISSLEFQQLGSYLTSDISSIFSRIILGQITEKDEEQITKDIENCQATLSYLDASLFARNYDIARRLLGSVSILLRNSVSGLPLSVKVKCSFLRHMTIDACKLFQSLGIKWNFKEIEHSRFNELNVSNLRMLLEHVTQDEQREFAVNAPKIVRNIRESNYVPFLTLAREYGADTDSIIESKWYNDRAPEILEKGIKIPIKCLRKEYGHSDFSVGKLCILSGLYTIEEDYELFCEVCRFKVEFDTPTYEKVHNAITLCVKTQDQAIKFLMNFSECSMRLEHLFKTPTHSEKSKKQRVYTQKITKLLLPLISEVSAHYVMEATKNANHYVMRVFKSLGVDTRLILESQPTSTGNAIIDFMDIVDCSCTGGDDILKTASLLKHEGADTSSKAVLYRSLEFQASQNGFNRRSSLAMCKSLVLDSTESEDDLLEYLLSRPERNLGSIEKGITKKEKMSLGLQVYGKRLNRSFYSLTALMLVIKMNVVSFLSILVRKGADLEFVGKGVEKLLFMRLKKRTRLQCLN